MAGWRMAAGLGYARLELHCLRLEIPLCFVSYYLIRGMRENHLGSAQLGQHFGKQHSSEDIVLLFHNFENPWFCGWRFNTGKNLRYSTNENQVFVTDETLKILQHYQCIVKRSKFSLVINCVGAPMLMVASLLWLFQYSGVANMHLDSKIFLIY